MQPCGLPPCGCTAPLDRWRTRRLWTTCEAPIAAAPRPVRAPDAIRAQLLWRWRRRRQSSAASPPVLHSPAMIVPADLDATALAALVRKREVKPSELVDAAIQRIEAENPRLNAVIWTCFDEARRAAEGPLGDGPFAGVPFLVKAYHPQIAGAPCAQGSRLGKAVVTRADSELVRRHRAAGLVVLGLTNVPELGLLPTTESVHHGPCKNPWDPSRTPGGSSGGSAAAVAAGWVPMAHGSDGGGSIRIPAACCGLFGLKPTRGRNPLSPMGDSLDGLSVEHA